MILKNAVIRQSEIANNLNTLFQEFAKDVLRIEAATIPVPVMPNPFSAFLEKDNVKTPNIEDLKSQRKQLKQHLRMVQEKIKSINEILEKAQKDQS